MMPKFFTFRDRNKLESLWQCWSYAFHCIKDIYNLKSHYNIEFLWASRLPIASEWNYCTSIMHKCQLLLQPETQLGLVDSIWFWLQILDQWIKSSIRPRFEELRIIMIYKIRTETTDSVIVIIIINLESISFLVELQEFMFGEIINSQESVP